MTNKMTSAAISVQLYYMQDHLTETFLTRKNVMNLDLKTETKDFVMLKTWKTFHPWHNYDTNQILQVFTQTNDFNINEDWRTYAQMIKWLISKTFIPTHNKDI